jgi:hypothetical protein
MKYALVAALLEFFLAFGGHGVDEVGDDVLADQ